MPVFPYQVTRVDGRRLGQRQDSLADQLRDVHQLAVQTGCYDAADAIRGAFRDVFQPLSCPVCGQSVRKSPSIGWTHGPDVGWVDHAVPNLDQPE